MFVSKLERLRNSSSARMRHAGVEKVADNCLNYFFSYFLAVRIVFGHLARFLFEAAVECHLGSYDC